MQQDYEKTPSGILVPMSELRVAGRYHGTLIRAGKVIDDFECDNLVVDEGLNLLLNVMLHGTTPVTTWYMAVFEGNYTPVAGVTAATIASASTECVAYASATRPVYDEAAATTKITTNSASRASFVFNATKTIYGAFLVSSSTKSGTSGSLFSAARFGSSKAVDSGDELLLTYTYTASST